MVCNYSKEEIYIIWKICFKNRWCNKHIDERDLVKGRPKDEIDLYEDAVRSLVKEKFLQKYNSQGRADICIPKKNRNRALEVLKAHEKEYNFIRNIECIR